MIPLTVMVVLTWPRTVAVLALLGASILITGVVVLIDRALARDADPD